jgi:hypothetical protein
VPRWLTIALALQTAAGPVASDDAVAVITVQERAWATAAVSKDLTAIDRLLHEHFRLVPLYEPDLGPTDRTDYLKLQESDPMWALRAMTPLAIDVDLRGDIPISTVDMEVGWPEGVPAPTDYRFTDIWVLHNGAWRVISRLSEWR